MKKAKGIGRVSGLFFIAIIFVISVINVQAATTTYELNYVVSGDQPAGTAPWLSATFDDSYGGANTVLITMNGLNLSGSENVTEWYFNFDDALDVSQLSFVEVGTSGVSPINVTTEMNSFKADGDGYFDIMFDFPPPPGNDPNRFNSTNNTVSYAVTYSSAISVWDFNFDSDLGGGQGIYKTAAHVQSIECPDPLNCPTGSTSGWLGATNIVPEPVSSTLFLVGAATLGFRRFRKKFKA
jgi:hypothetical protein